MKTRALLMTILACGLTAFAQDSVSPEDKALLEKLRHDSSFIVINRDSAESLVEINSPKQKLYQAYLEKPEGVVKVFKRARAGWEGQYTMTWLTVDHGKVRIVEAYFGDPSGSRELQYVRQYAPEEIKLGSYDKNRKCVPLTGNKIPRGGELCIGYIVTSEQREKIF